MGLRELLKRYKEVTRPILRDIKGNVLKESAWYLEYSDDKIGFPCYFTGEFEKSSFLTGDSGYAIVEGINSCGSYFKSLFPSRCTEQLVPIENPKEYLESLKQEIDRRSKLPIKQLSKANLPTLKRAEEWMKDKLERLAQAA